METGNFAQPTGPAQSGPAEPAPAGAPAEFRVPVAAILDAARAAERGELLAEIGKLGKEKAGWGQNLIVLAVSFALFFALGLLKSPLVGLIIIVAAIAVHELGHYLGMRLFGYRDVRMFFIPLFGAAVSGRGGSVAGWKRAVVALLGPLPGLMVGTACAGLYAFTGEALLWQLARVFLLLNAFNLLPFYPLDGGRLVFDVLLSRNRHLEAAFRVTSGALLAAAGLAVSPKDGWILGVFGLLVILGTPGAFRLGRMVARLRPALGELAAAGAESGTVPPEAVDRLAAEVRREYPRLPDLRAVAWRVQSLWERLGTRAPGAPATLGFLAVQGLALAFGAVATLAVLGLGTETRLESFIQPDSIADFREATYLRLGHRLVQENEVSPSGLYNGRSVTYNVVTGAPMAESGWLDGRRHDQWREYDVRGRLASVTVYDRGRFVSRRELAASGWVEKRLADMPADFQAACAEQKDGPPLGPKGWPPPVAAGSGRSP